MQCEHACFVCDARRQVSGTTCGGSKKAKLGWALMRGARVCATKASQRCRVQLLKRAAQPGGQWESQERPRCLGWALMQGASFRYDTMRFSSDQGVKEV